MPALPSQPHPLTVLHCCERWLPLTQMWLYQQIRLLPPEIVCHIACSSLINIEQFSLPNIHVSSKLPGTTKLAHRVWRRFGQAQMFESDIAQHCGARLLHSHFGHVAWANLVAARRVSASHLATFYGFDVGHLPQTNPVWRRRYLDLFEKIDGVLCEGPFMAKCIAALGCPEAKIRVHHLGVDVEALPFQPRRWQTGTPLRVLIAASFTEKKGVPYALKALSHIAEDVELQITVIGDAPASAEGQAEKSQILDVARYGKIENICRFLGYRPYEELRREAYSHHIFLSPSVTAASGDTEGGAPMTLPEMAATGMPVVSTRHCDIPNVVIDKVTGLLADERDVDGLVFQLRTLISRPDDWEPMLVAARQRIENEFNARIQAARLAGIYQLSIRDKGLT